MIPLIFGYAFLVTLMFTLPVRDDGRSGAILTRLTVVVVATVGLIFATGVIG